MDQDILNKLSEQDAKIEQILASQEKMRKYFFWTFVITVAVIVLPLIGLAFVIPQFINMYANIGAGF